MSQHVRGKLVTGETVEIRVRDGLIDAIEPWQGHTDHFVGAGLVDLQVNGYFGLDLNHAPLPPERVIALAHKLFEHGVTTWLPTLITASRDDLVQGLRAISLARQASPLVAHAIVGIHVEGPFISPTDGARGAHPLEHVREPDLEEVRSWQEVSSGLVRLVTLSPQSDRAIAFVADLVAMGIHVAIGHTDATPGQIHAAAQAGASLSTHLGNGAPANLPRHPNFIWAQLADDRLTASFIADGHHLPADTLKAMLRAKGLERSILVSDVAAVGGLEPGIYDQPIGGRVQLWPDGRLGVAGTPYLAGAALTLDHCIARAVRTSGLRLYDIYPLATSRPGRFVGGRGSLAVGMPADLVTFRWQEGRDALEVLSTMVRGERVWQR
ncbi:MAG: N-acetylglucosamine-6-phosphate deacetylase [Devosia sp.]|uniref:N-acetylglucosamine-6-phosphate deacetylase n=1 Tax=Devosia sp. TaxID=1871048 RepID=UPI002620D1E8|nr:amidohydrolase family protein [Devosia sp.]MDB5529464.1 N-acetylglucosamine-6-phosphate deacetylase [Devosia sp.]